MLDKWLICFMLTAYFFCGLLLGLDAANIIDRKLAIYEMNTVKKQVITPAYINEPDFVGEPSIEARYQMIRDRYEEKMRIKNGK